MEWVGLGVAGAAVWVAAAAAAARVAVQRGYPVILISLVLGPLGLLAMLHLTRVPRPGPESRHLLLQWAALAREGLPAGSLPEPSEPRLARLAERARQRGTQPAFARGLQDLVGFERLWDRVLPWLVLNGALAVLGGVLLLVATVAIFRSPAPVPGLLALVGLPLLGLALRRLLREEDPLGMEGLLARGQALHLARLEILAGEAAEGDPEPLAREVGEEVARRLREARRRGRTLGFLLAGLGVLAAVLARLLG